MFFLMKMISPRSDLMLAGAFCFGGLMVDAHQKGELVLPPFERTPGYLA
jgi:hypothetical protein